MTRRRSLACIAPLLLALTPATSSADDFAATLCAALADVVPRVQGYQPEGVRAQLVMKIAGDFDYDPDALSRVSNEIDEATSANCPDLRTRAIALAATPTLRDAVR